MSGQAMGVLTLGFKNSKFDYWDHVRCMPDISDSSKLLCIHLTSRYGNSETGVCWPSIARLAEDLHKNRRSITRALKELESVGLLEIKRDAGRKKTNIYLVPENALDAAQKWRKTLRESSEIGGVEATDKPTEKGDNTVMLTTASVGGEQERVTILSKKGDKSVQKGCQTCHTNLSKELISNNSSQDDDFFENSFEEVETSEHTTDSSISWQVLKSYSTQFPTWLEYFREKGITPPINSNGCLVVPYRWPQDMPNSVEAIFLEKFAGQNNRTSIEVAAHG